jgi:uncharacterized protein YkwD
VVGLSTPLVAALAAAALAVPAAPASPRITNPEKIEPEIAAEINRVRRRHGLRPLKLAAPLARAGDAHAHALAVAGAFTHDWPGGAPFLRWMPRFYPHTRFRFWSAGENLLWSAVPITPRSIVALWLASPKHRRVLLRPSWLEVGVGVVHAARAGGAYGGLDVHVVAAELGARR